MRHRSFILALWQESGALPNAPPAWRISLEDPLTSERKGFTELAELDAFLNAWMDDKASNAGGADGRLREQ